MENNKVKNNKWRFVQLISHAGFSHRIFTFADGNYSIAQESKPKINFSIRKGKLKVENDKT